MVFSVANIVKSGAISIMDFYLRGKVGLPNLRIEYD